jgi:ATP-binding cassette subfamily F protein 3
MITFQNLSKTFGQRFLFKEINYLCPANARIALIGNNGAGKTTLLNIICGLDTNFEGKIVIPKNCRMGYLPQIYNQHPLANLLAEALSGAEEINAIVRERDEVLLKMEQNYSQKLYDRFEVLEQQFKDHKGYRIEEDTKRMLKGFGFQEEQFDQPVTQLSGGWRMRLEFVKMLINKPNFLILDEPTNHLDLPSIKWFEEFLQKYDGTIFFVSHDKDLLNRLATHVLHLRQGKISEYLGNFDAFLEGFALKQTQSSHAARQLDLKHAQIQTFVNKFRATASKAKQVQSNLKTLMKLEMLKDAVEVEQLGDTINLTLQNPKPSGKVVLQVNKVSIGYEKPLLEKLTFNIERGMRLAILGANGLGKTTLLKTLLGLLKPLKGTVDFGHNVHAGYFAQESIEGLDEADSVLNNALQANTHLREQDLRCLLGNLGIYGNDVKKKVGVLSGGEKSRVALACLLAKQPNTLFLDEPTNHLDLSACENLAISLANFSGSVIFVSHNSAFINSVATHTLYLEPYGKYTLTEVAS